MPKLYDSNDLREEDILERVGELLPEVLASSAEAVLFAKGLIPAGEWAEFCESEKKHCYDHAVDVLLEELNSADEHADWLGAS